MIIHWTVSPEIFEVGPLRLRWYGLFFLVGFLIGLKIIEKICLWEGKPKERVETGLIYTLIGTAVGARLGHCFFYESDYFLEHPLEIFAIWKGGLASHGGGIGVILSLFLFSRKYSEFPFLWLLDRVSIPTALTGGFIRIGNLMNSEILGKPTDGSWGFIFDHIDQVARHPTQIYESLCYFLVFAIGLRVYLHYKEKLPGGLLFGITISGLFSARIVLEFFKENQEKFESDWILNMGQLLSIPYILVGVFLIWNALKKQNIPAPQTSKNRRR